MGITFSVGRAATGGSQLRKTLLKHFGVPAGEIATAGRQFPITARVDIQSALEGLFKTRSDTTLFGITSMNMPQPPSLANALAGSHLPIDAGPLQHDEIDVGEAVPVRCLKNGLWISRDKGLPFAVLLAPGGRFGLHVGVQMDIPCRLASAAPNFRRSFSGSSSNWLRRAERTGDASSP
jgi:hypothetical protein